jgi:hypothetical protein
MQQEKSRLLASRSPAWGFARISMSEANANFQEFRVVRCRHGGIPPCLPPAVIELSIVGDNWNAAPVIAIWLSGNTIKRGS